MKNKHLLLYPFVLFLSLTIIFLSGCSNTQNIGLKNDYSYIPDESSSASIAGFSDSRSGIIIQNQEVDEADLSNGTEDILSIEDSSNCDAEVKAEEILGSMTLNEKIYQLFIVTQEQLTGVGQVTKSGDVSKKSIQQMQVGGIIYFEPNIVTPEQCTEMIQNIQSFSKLGLFIAVDEEGGRVARLGNNPDMGTTAFPGGQAAIGKTGDPEQAYIAGCTIGTDISRFGFNLNLSPVAEITDDVEHSVIGERSFGGDPVLTAQMVSSMVKGLHEGGVLCTLKHFPGHGDTTSDPHNGYTEMSKSLEDLMENDFVPFRAGAEAGADFLMMGHFSSPQLTGDDVPATLSKQMITLAKEQLDFAGLIMTDSLSMGAITDRYSSGEAAVMALQAGADIILMPQNLDEAVDGVSSAIENGEISVERIDESVKKILLKKLEAGIIL